MNKRIDYDNACEINNSLNRLSEFKLLNNKDKYNNEIDKIILLAYQPINSILLSDSIIIRCINELHLGELHKDDNQNVIIHQTYKSYLHKTKSYYTCQIIRRTPKDKSPMYSIEEKMMLNIFISVLFYRISKKVIIVPNNYNYISIKDIHKMFGNKIEGLKQSKCDYYTNIVNNLINDNVEIHIGDNNTYGTKKYIGWFSKIHAITDYDGKIKGYLYSFGDLDTWLYNSLSKSKIIYPKSVTSRNLQVYDFVYYIINSIKDKVKKISVVELLENLYDYNNGDTYKNVLYKKSNPSDYKYLQRITDFIFEAFDFTKEDYNTIELYYDFEKIDKKSFKAHMNKKEYFDLSIRIN